MAHHVLNAGPETCHWGFFDASYEPKLRIADGDSVTIKTISGAPDTLPKHERFIVPPELPAVHAALPRPPSGHILTGPIYIEGAEPGDTLEVKIESVMPRTNWGYMTIRPLMGTLVDDFHTTRIETIAIDMKRMVATMPWGLELALKPFFGVMGVAPPPAWRRISTSQPRAHGGNIDNKELVAGSSLYLPVFVDGALFSTGDGHGLQGDGEVCVTAIETALEGRFTFRLHKKTGLQYPWAETDTHYITMGMDPDLDQCAIRALREMIAFMGKHAGLSPEEAYLLCSAAVDLHVTQTVNGHKGIHCMAAKSLFSSTRRSPD
ncbi:amidase [Agrobacterium tumefaciens str. Cherry 2E-2-2]|nr:amidase [Agrobacterium tumefaciens str. Cherry 2E-2-2]